MILDAIYTSMNLENITLLIELHLITWWWQIQLTRLSLVRTSSGHCMILCMITELRHLLPEVQDIVSMQQKLFEVMLFVWSLVIAGKKVYKPASNDHRLDL